MIRNQAKKSNTKRLIIIALIVLALAALALFVLEKSNTTHFFSTDMSNDDRNAKTTSKLPTAQDDFTGGDSRSIDTSNKTEGTIADKKGNITVTPSESQWTKSPSGAITVYTPAKSAVLKSGDSLSGTTTTSGKVSFRLNDNVSGMIALGTLDIVNGKFSGAFDFSTSATEGQIDVFTQSDDGMESNNVSIPVRFE